MDDTPKNGLHSLVYRLKTKFDEAIFDFRARHDLFAPVQILTYRSYGTQNRLYVKGRVLANKGITSAADDHTVVDNLINLYRRFETDEIPNVALTISFQGHDHFVVTDEEGFFVLNIEPVLPLSQDNLYQEVIVTLTDSPLKDTPSGLTAKAEVMVPPHDAEFGIISDIDDTIIKTGATNLLKMAETSIFHNSRTRLPFTGTTAFFRSLLLGKDGKRNNPFFYVSSSPWNLYDMLSDYLDVQKIPHGPILLRDIGVSSEHFMGKDHMGHKMHEIENILVTYPTLPFVLIGDSGQQDPVIYKEVVKRFPGRIKAIYIRDVELPERAQVAVTIADELKASGEVEMLLVENSLKAAEHAASIGLIESFRVKEVAEDKFVDELLPEDPEEAIIQQEEGDLKVPAKKE